MNTSDLIDKIAPALLAAQKEIGNAAKDSKNPHFKSSYASLGSVIDAVKEVANKHGIVIVQTPSGASIGSTGVCLTTRLIHISGQWIEDMAHTPLPKQDAQGVGSALTYLRRYSLAAFFCITQADDDGNDAVSPPAATPIAKTTVKAPVGKAVLDDPF